MSVLVVNNISELRKQIEKYKKDGLKIGLVPTMGCLHNGHASLIEKSVEKCDVTVVSVFVNPVQFGPNEDYNKYPRTFDKDKELVNSLGADIIFSPSADEMYPETTIHSNLTMVIPPFGLTDLMCGKSRIGHFDGVCTVVTKLFNIVQPDYAFFGMKDIQQLYVLRKMVSDLNFQLEIVPCPLIREESGLALSSRNRYLSDEDKKIALTISKSLFALKAMVKSGIVDTKNLFNTVIANLDKSIELDYLEFVEAENFTPVKEVNGKTIAAIAAKVNNVRLIDNVIIGE